MTRRSLPIVRDAVGALRRDGTRVSLYPADVRGRFATARRVVFVALIVLWAALPWIRIRGNPALFLDIERRRFFLFGATLNAQDAWLGFFLVTGVAFALVYATALLGRAWCGWACPQTVFLEGIYRPIERLLLGSRDTRLRASREGWTVPRFLKTALAHALYIVISFAVAHVFLSYFVSLPGVFAMMRGSPRAHPEAFAWALVMTAAFYANFAWFREQMCLIVCPYGRLQSALLDSDSLIVGYDVGRGEPRGKLSDTGAGDCVDCRRCVTVCPTGIDIRDGLQLDCVACTACIDACDEVMDKVARPRGLIRYDSLNGLEGKPRKIVRPRIVLYTGLLAVGALVASIALAGRADVEANLLRLPGLPYTSANGVLTNAFEVHLVNKRGTSETFVLAGAPDARATYIIPISEVTVGPFESRRLPVFVTTAEASFSQDFPVRVDVRRASGEVAKVATGRFLGARR